MAEKPKDRLSRLDTLMSLGNWVFRAAVAVSAFAIPAWAARAANILGDYAPFSWVAIGIVSGLLVALAYALVGWGRGKSVRARYDKRMLAKGGVVDPLEKTFERKRIFLNEFALPSHALIVGKTFIDCEIIGPANVILQTANQVTEQQYPICDTVLMHSTANPYNGYIFRNCTFRGCSFQRITLLVPVSEYHTARGVDWLNWITPYPDGEDQIRLPLPPTPGQTPPPLEITGETDDEPKA